MNEENNYELGIHTFATDKIQSKLVNLMFAIEDTKKQLRTSIYGGVTKEETSLHGFRTTARTIGDEVLEIRTDVLEVGLSHKNPTDKHGGAYARAEFKKQLKLAMQQWADYCDGLKNE